LSDPTDHALAAIASILDQPEAHPEPEKAAVEEKPIPPELIEADGYHKVGRPAARMMATIMWMRRLARTQRPSSADQWRGMPRSGLSTSARGRRGGNLNN